VAPARRSSWTMRREVVPRTMESSTSVRSQAWCRRRRRIS
jgi:hypothetical protein